MSTDIYIDSSDKRSAPGRVDYIGSQSWDEQPNILHGKALELKTRAGREPNILLHQTDVRNLFVNSELESRHVITQINQPLSMGLSLHSHIIR